MYTLSHMCQQMVESEAQGFNIGTEGPPAFTDHGQKFLTFISKTALFPPQVLTCHMSNSVSTLKPGMQKAYFGYKEGSVKFLGKVYRPVFLSIFCTALYHWVPFCDFL